MKNGTRRSPGGSAPWRDRQRVQVAVASRTSPITMQETNIIRMKKYVGAAKISPGLPHASQVPPGDDPDEHDREPHPIRVEARRRGDDRRDAGRDRDRDGEDVVGEQGDAGELRGEESEVVLRDDVRAAGARVGLDRLAVGRTGGSRARPGSPKVIGITTEKARTPTRRDRDLQDLLGGVGDRGQVVAREDREGRGLPRRSCLSCAVGSAGPRRTRLRPAFSWSGAEPIPGGGAVSGSERIPIDALRQTRCHSKGRRPGVRAALGKGSSA